jgi:protein-S-isoprenylcysteine O-methyltransferase Ste14
MMPIEKKEFLWGGGGLWLFLGSLFPAIVIPLFAWLIQERFIKIEEQMLEEKFGAQYQDYQQKVRRWL